MRPNTANGTAAAIETAAARSSVGCELLESSACTVEDRKALLRHFAAASEVLTSHSLRVVASLAVIRVHPCVNLELINNVDAQDIEHTAPDKVEPMFVSIASSDVLYIPPVQTSSQLLGPTFVNPWNISGELSLLKRLGVVELSSPDFLITAVLPRLDRLQSDVRDTALVASLKAGHHLAQPKFGMLLRTTRFVPVADGRLRRPDELYDPATPEIEHLLDASAWFPSGQFASEDMLLLLVGLGLQQEVNLQSLIGIAQAIDEDADAKPHEAFRRGKALLNFIDANYGRLFKYKKRGPFAISKMLGHVNAAKEAADQAAVAFFRDLCLLRWIPVLGEPPSGELIPWSRSSPGVTTPVSARLEYDAWLVSASLGIVANSTIVSDHVCNHLGWNSAAPVKAVAKQLTSWETHLRSIDAARRPAVLAKLSRTIMTSYDILAAALAAGPPHSIELAAQLDGEAWVWTGEPNSPFVIARKTVFSSRVDCHPYIYTLPVAAAQQHPDLFRELGVREQLSCTDFIEILAEIAAKYDTSGDSSGDTLAQADLDIMITLAHRLADAVAGGARLDSDVYIPDATGRVALSSTVVYNDSAWSPPAQHALVHPHISNQVARAIGVRSLIALVISGEENEGLGYEAYGQTESLTSRLAGLLEVYPDGVGIVKELVQNADDAGASCVRILFSMETWGTTSLLGDSLAKWQGPALYVYNDAVFAEKDFANLASLASSIKASDSVSIGKFGCGWNSIYHLTDVPSIVSGDHLVMLDPNKKYLPDIATAPRPGLKVKFTGSRLKQQFPDQFAPLCSEAHGFGCDMMTSFK